MGKPEMLRIGDAPTQHQAELDVYEVIDCALNVEKEAANSGRP
jgi:hypothetical protein